MVLTIHARGHKRGPSCQACGLHLARPRTSTPTTLRPTGALQVSTAPHVGDLRLVVHAQADAPLGQIDLQLGFGKGSKGRGQRIGNDTALYVSTLRRLAASIVVYASDFETAAAEDTLPDLAPTCPLCVRESAGAALCNWCREDLAAQARAHASLACDCGRPKPAGTAFCSECIPF